MYPVYPMPSILILLSVGHSSQWMNKYVIIDWSLHLIQISLVSEKRFASLKHSAHL